MKLQQKSLFIMLFFCFFSSILISQNKRLDSLKILSKSQKKVNKFQTFLDISTIYIGINLDSAKFYTNKAYNISKEINNDSLKIKALMALGFRNFEFGNYSKAIQNFDKALPISIQIKDSTSIADIYNGFAITFSKQGDLNKSIEYNFKTLSVYENINDSLGIGNSYLNIGWDYRKLKEFKKSLKYNFKSLEVYQKIKDSMRVAMIHNNIAGTQNELGDYKEALKYSTKSKNYFLKPIKLKIFQNG